MNILMNRIVRLILAMALLGALSLYHACVKPPDYPQEPVIRFESMSKNVLKQGANKEDSLQISFSYTDGDGDLGFERDEDPADVFVSDSRDPSLQFQYKLPYVDPVGAGNGISGDITISVPTSCCIYILATTPDTIKVACNQAANYISRDTLTYKIRIRDRAGHFSNTIETEPITLICKE